MFFWWCLCAFIEASTPSGATQKAIQRTHQFLDAISVLANAKSSELAPVQNAVDNVKITLQDILTIATSNLRDTPALYSLQQSARQIINFLLMVIFVEQPEKAERLIVLLTENKTDPEMTKQVVQVFGYGAAHHNIHAMLTSQEPAALAGQKGSRFNREQRAGFEAKVIDFYTDLYELDPEILKATKNNFNRNVAIGALALTIAGVIASVALGATLIGLPTALGLLASTIGGPGAMAVKAWNDHKADQLTQRSGPTMAVSFKAIAATIEQLKKQLEVLQEQTKTACPVPIPALAVEPPPPGKLDRAKQFFSRLGGS